jgi:hypothetical protein
MTGNDDRNRVRGHHSTDGTRRSRCAGPLGQFSIGNRLAIGDLTERGNNSSLELGQWAATDDDIGEAIGSPGGVVL